MTTAIVIVLSLATVVVLGVFAAARRTRTRRPVRTPPAPSGGSSPPDPAADPDFFDPRTIRVGDTVYVEAARYRAVGALHCTVLGEKWTEYLLDEGARRYNWLSVEERPGVEGEALHLEVLLWTDVPTQGILPDRARHGRLPLRGDDRAARAGPARLRRLPGGRRPPAVVPACPGWSVGGVLRPSAHPRFGPGGSAALISGVGSASWNGALPNLS